MLQTIYFVNEKLSISGCSIVHVSHRDYTWILPTTVPVKRARVCVCGYFRIPCSTCARCTLWAVLGRGRKGALQHRRKPLSPGGTDSLCRPTELWQQQYHGEPSPKPVAYIMWQGWGHGPWIHRLLGLFHHSDITASSPLNSHYHSWK